MSIPHAAASTPKLAVVRPPSGMVRDLMYPERCISCRERPATKRAGGSGRPGTDLCGRCWRAEFTDADGEL